jgi:hypothetical protein
MRVKKGMRDMLLERKIVQEIIAGKSNRQISMDYSVCHKKVAKIKKLAEEAGYLNNQVPLPPYPENPFPGVFQSRQGYSDNEHNLLPLLDEIKEKLNAGWHKISIYENISISVSRSSFYRFLIKYNLLAQHEKQQKRLIPEIYHEPGESLLLDWGHLRTIVDNETGKKKKLWAFVGVLGYSRYMCVRLVWTCDTKTTIEALEDIFRELGGVAKRVTTDNPKCFAIEASDYEPILNPAFERFAEHYGFLVECLPPRDPQKKGKVERLMPFVRRLCEPYTEFISKDHMQEFLNRKIILANERKHGTTLLKPFEVFIQKEVSSLKPLPPLSYVIEEFSEGKCRQDGYVRFCGKYYSIGCEYSGKDIFIIANESKVSFYHKGKLIEGHPRINNSDKYKSTKKHHLKEWEQSLEDAEFYVKKAKEIGINCMNLIQIILSQGRGFIDNRIIWGILSLDKKYTKSSVDLACEKALKVKSYSYRSVLNFLENPIYEPKKPYQLKTETHEFIRDFKEYQIL